MTNEAKDTCDGESSPTGRCDPSHPLHCCHLAITGSQDAGPMIVLFSWCTKCGKRSRTKTLVKNYSGVG